MAWVLLTCAVIVSGASCFMLHIASKTTGMLRQQIPCCMMLCYTLPDRLWLSYV